MYVGISPHKTFLSRFRQDIYFLGGHGMITSDVFIRLVELLKCFTIRCLEYKMKTVVVLKISSIQIVYAYSLFPYVVYVVPIH